MYKNSDGNTSITNIMGTWRYFNSNLKKIGSMTPQQISLSQPNIKIKDPSKNLKLVGEFLNNAKSAYDIQEDVSFKKADDFINSHSLEEYQKLMREGNVPFQFDPIARGRLKYQTGRIASGLADQMFKERVDRNELQGLTPEQVSEEYYKTKREVSASLSDTFSFTNDSDRFYRSGLYEDAKDNSLKFIARQQEVENDFNVRMAFLQDASRLKTIVEGTGTPDEIWDDARDVFANGSHYSVEQISQLYNTFINAVSDSGRGDELLTSFKDRVIDGLGVTFSDFMGETNYQTKLLEAKNFRNKLDANAYSDWKFEINQISKTGDYNKLNALLDIEFNGNGNVYTDRVKYLESARDKALTVAEAQKAKALSQAKEIQKEENAKAYLGDLYNQGSRTADGSVAYIGTPDSYGTSSTAIKNVFKDAIERGRYSYEDVAYMANNPTAEVNPAKDHIADVGYNVVDQIRGAVAEAEVNKTKIPQIPKSLDEALTYYRINPSLFGDASKMSENERYYLSTVAFLMENGNVPYEEIIRNLAEYNEKVKNKPEFASLVRKSIENSLSDSDFSGKIDYGYYTPAIVNNAMAMVRAKGKNISAQEAIDLGIQKFQREHVNVYGGWLPYSALGFSDKLDTTVKTEMLNDVIKSAAGNKDVSVFFRRGTITVMDNETLKPVYEFPLANMAVAAERMLKEHPDQIQALINKTQRYRDNSKWTFAEQYDGRTQSDIESEAEQRYSDLVKQGQERILNGK